MIFVGLYFLIGMLIQGHLQRRGETVATRHSAEQSPTPRSSLCVWKSWGKTDSHVCGNLTNKLRFQIVGFVRSVPIPLLMVRCQCQRIWPPHGSCCWSCWPDLRGDLPLLKKLYPKWGNVAFNCLCDILVSLLRQKETLSEMLSAVITSVGQLNKLLLGDSWVAFPAAITSTQEPVHLSLGQMYFFFFTVSSFCPSRDL